MRGAWIEIMPAFVTSQVRPGRSPCGERGLKFIKLSAIYEMAIVAPHAGSVD